MQLIGVYVKNEGLLHFYNEKKLSRMSKMKKK